jgi:hypothetical protein
MKTSTLVILLTVTSRLVQSYKLQCDYGQRTHISYIKDYQFNGYGCNATLVENKCKGFVTEVSDDHEGLRSNKDVKFIFFVEYQVILGLPGHADDFFPEILCFTARYVHLQEVKSKDFLRFPKLKLIDVSNNNLTQIPSNLFKYTPDLQQVYLNDNPILHVGTKLFNYLNMQKVYLFAVGQTSCAYYTWAMYGDKKQLEIIRKGLLEKCKATPEMNEEDRKEAATSKRSKNFFIKYQITLYKCGQLQE